VPINERREILFFGTERDAPWPNPGRYDIRMSWRGSRHEKARLRIPVAEVPHCGAGRRCRLLDWLGLFGIRCAYGRHAAPFHMPGSWEFQWDSKGQFFQVMLYHRGESSGQAMPNILANQISGGPGSSYGDSGGDFYLVINAMGPWSAKAVLVNQ
jgi:hypothetical protein